MSVQEWWDAGEHLRLRLDPHRQVGVRTTDGRRSDADLAARLPELVARLGEGGAGPRRAPRARAPRLPRLRRVRQADGSHLLAARAGRPRRGRLGAARASPRPRCWPTTTPCRSPRSCSPGAPRVGWPWSSPACTSATAACGPTCTGPSRRRTALLDPEQGPQLERGADQELLTGAVRNTFADGYDSRPGCADIWQATARDDGQRIAHLLIRYILDRREHEQRGRGTGDDRCTARLHLGCADPSPAARGAAHRERLPHARCTCWKTSVTGHRSRRPTGSSRMFSAGVAPHRSDDRAAGRQPEQRPLHEPVPLVERDVARVRALQVRRQPVLVALLEHRLQQRAPDALPARFRDQPTASRYQCGSRGCAFSTLASTARARGTRSPYAGTNRCSSRSTSAPTGASGSAATTPRRHAPPGRRGPARRGRARRTTQRHQDAGELSLQVGTTGEHPGEDGVGKL